MSDGPTNHWRTVGLLFVAVAILIVFSPTLFWAVLVDPADFWGKSMITVVSPDGAYNLEVIRRVDFPALDPFEPPTTVVMIVTDLAGKRTRATYPIHQPSEFLKPQVEWGEGQVILKGLDYHNPEAVVVMNLP